MGVVDDWVGLGAGLVMYKGKRYLWISNGFFVSFGSSCINICSLIHSTSSSSSCPTVSLFFTSVCGCQLVSQVLSATRSSMITLLSHSPAHS